MSTLLQAEIREVQRQSRVDECNDDLKTERQEDACAIFLSNVFADVSDNQIAEALVAGNRIQLYFYRGMQPFINSKAAFSDLDGYKALEQRLAGVEKKIENVEYVQRRDTSCSIWLMDVHRLFEQNEIHITCGDLDKKQMGAQPQQLKR